MKQYYCKAGLIHIGDTLEFHYGKTTKLGKLESIKSLFFSDEILLSIYYMDDTGAFTIDIPVENVIRISMEGTKLEDIKKPSRYNKRGNLECWDVILDQKMNFLEGSVLKYLWRYKEKNGVHDLEKAKVYIDKIIEGLKK